MTGEATANQIYIIEKAGFDIKDCRGKGFDRANNMSSEAVGVQACIKALCQKAICIHCCEHNLAVVSACKLPII